MKLHALEIPDEPAELAGWLERQLVSLDLALLVAELSAVHGPAPSIGPSVRDLLANQYDEVLARGLGTLPARTLGYFLLRPRLLLELQEIVLGAGGPFWDRLVDQAAGLDEPVTAGRGRLRSFLDRVPAAGIEPVAGSTATASSQRRTIGPSAARRGERSAPAWYRHPAVVSFATAAAVLAGVALYNQRATIRVAPAVASAWGWNNPASLRVDLPGDRYLDALADAADEWFDQPVADRSQLARRIGEFRQGCSALILADHTPLPIQDRLWLVERCRVWADKLDSHLAAVEAGGDLTELVEQTGETVRSLIDALRMRASGLRNA